jgi:hypothetical protein
LSVQLVEKDQQLEASEIRIDALHLDISKSKEKMAKFNQCLQKEKEDRLRAKKNAQEQKLKMEQWT